MAPIPTTRLWQFNPVPARRGIDCLDASFAEWSTFLDEHPSEPLPDITTVDRSLDNANRRAVEVVRWVRSVDDFLRGHDTGYEPAPRYEAARAADAEIEGLLDGLRYAAHKSLHVLVGVAIGPPPMDVISGTVVGPPQPPARPQRGNVPVYRWPDLRWLVHLAGRDRNAAERMAYERHLWDGPVDQALTRAVEWLRTQRP